MVPSSFEILTFPVNSTNGTMVCRSISIIDDDDIEGDETFTVDVIGSDVPISNMQAVITITDNDG